MHSDPTNYRPTAVLPTLSCVFELLLINQLQRLISPYIPPEQFGFLKRSSTSDVGVSLTSTVTTAINHRAEVRLVAQEDFNHVQWDSLLEHLWNIDCRSRVFNLLKFYLSDQYIKVVIPSDLYPVSPGVPQSTIWSPLLFNLYVLLPYVSKYRSVVGYADDHTLFKTISSKDNRITAAAHLNADLAVLCEYGHH